MSGKEQVASKTRVRGLAKILLAWLVNLLLAVVVAATAFCFGSSYFRAKRSTTCVVLATGFSGGILTVYKPVNGGLDAQPAGSGSPLAGVLISENCALLDASGKQASWDSLAFSGATPALLSLTALPDGHVYKARLLSDLLDLEGEIGSSAAGRIKVGAQDCDVSQALVTESGKKLSEDGTGFNTGDLVKVWGHGDAAFVVDVMGRGATINVWAGELEARVYVDGAYKDKTPCQVRVSPGAKRVVVKAAGHKDYATTVDLAPGDRIDVVADIRPVTATLIVESVPPGANICLDGEFKGKSPVSLEVFPGQYSVSAELEGYHSKSQDVLLVGERAENVSLMLSKAPAPSGGRLSAAGSRKETIGYSAQGTVMATQGNVFYLGDRWDPHEITPGTSSFFKAGDTVRVSGVAPQQIQKVEVVEPLTYKTLQDGFCVAFSDRTVVFGETGPVGLTVTPSLLVVDAFNRLADNIDSVPAGSQIQFYLDSKGLPVWAEYLQRAETSVRGSIGSISGNSVCLTSSSTKLSINMGTLVFLGDERTSFFDLQLGDEVIAAGSDPTHIEFILIEKRLQYDRIADGVVVPQDHGQDKVFYEIDLIPGGNAYPLVAAFGTQFAEVGGCGNLDVASLEWGDRVRLWLGPTKEVLWGVVQERCNCRIAGRFLGERDGAFYFTGYEGLTPRHDLVTVGLFGGANMTPGARVMAAGCDGALTYLEVQDNPDRLWSSSGTIISVAKGTVCAWAGSFNQYAHEADARFVDWVSRCEDLLTGLFPGDKVEFFNHPGGPIFWAERIYSPPFKLSGTVLYKNGNVLTVGDDYSSSTVKINVGALIIRDGNLCDIDILTRGDRVSVSGRGFGSIDTVVADP